MPCTLRVVSFNPVSFMWGRCFRDEYAMQTWPINHCILLYTDRNVNQSKAIRSRDFVEHPVKMFV